MSDTSTRSIQIISYLKRHPSLTREEFYAHWKDNHAPIVLPWFKKHQMIRYQQIHASGSIVPNFGVDPASSSTVPMEFDGIALSLVPSMDGMAGRFEDPYFTDVIEGDEAKFLDRNAPGKGVIAIFFGHSENILEVELSGERENDDKK